MIVLPPNLKKSMGRLRKNRWTEQGEYRPGIIEKELPHLDAIYVSNMTTIPWHAKKIVQNKLEDPVLPKDLVVLLQEIPKVREIVRW